MSIYERDVVDFGIRPDQAIDYTPRINEMHAALMDPKSVVRVVKWGPGNYTLESPPQPILVSHLQHIGYGAVIRRAFRAPADNIGAFNFQQGGFRLRGFGWASTGRSEGTGCLISVVAQLDDADGVCEWDIEHNYVTSEVVSGGHKFGLYIDGSVGGKAGPGHQRVRGYRLTNNQVFGHPEGGASILLRSANGGVISGGGFTPGGRGGNFATMRIDGYPNLPGGSNTQIRMACYRLEFDNAADLTVDAPWIYSIHRNPATTHNITVRGLVYSGDPTKANAVSTGGWTGSDGKECVYLRR